MGLNHLTIPTTYRIYIIYAASHLCNTEFLKIGDPERARTVDLQRDRLAF